MSTLEFVEYDTEANGRPVSLNQFCAAVHIMNAKWWKDPATGAPIMRNKRQMLQLMLSEISEAMEAERKSKPGRIIMDDKIPTRPGAEVEIADTMIRLADWCGGWGVILRDYLREWHANFMPWAMFGKDHDRGEMLFCVSSSIIQLDEYGDLAAESRLFYDLERYAMHCGYDLWGAVEEKLRYNLVRVDHTDKHRIATGGKAW